MSATLIYKARTVTLEATRPDHSWTPIQIGNARSVSAVGDLLSRLFDAIPPKVLRALTLRFDRAPFDTVERLCEFVQTRAAYVAQTSLYGYLKTRMGTKYRILFEDEVFSKSINQAKWRVYASCLSDLAVFSAATANKNKSMNDVDCSNLAYHLMEIAIKDTFVDVEEHDLADTVIEKFKRRIAQEDWANAAQGENAFQKSPADLIEFAPVVDEFKELDREIVTNSTRFRWRDVREQLRKRIDSDALSTDWLANKSKHMLKTSK